jgi:3-methyl-2-oxobutanoate hydroxymethyltransferase
MDLSGNTYNKKMKTISDLYEMKKKGEIVAWSTCYNSWQSKICNDVGCDLVLCGDSFGNVEMGYGSTTFVNLEDMLSVVRNVRRVSPDLHICGDYPFGSYEISNEQAVETAIKFIKNGANSIKLEGSSPKILERIKAISDIGIPTMSHISVKPQSASSSQLGFRCQGKTTESFEAVYKEAKDTINAGAVFVLVEGMVEKSAKQIQKSFKQPIYSIGAGKLDGVLSIFHDTVGLFPSFRPYFSKNFIPDVINNFKEQLEREIANHGTAKKFGKEFPHADGLYHLAYLCMEKYVKDVKSGEFPSKEYCYPFKDSEIEIVRTSMSWKKENE